MPGLQHLDIRFLQNHPGKHPHWTKSTRWRPHQPSLRLAGPHRKTNPDEQAPNQKHFVKKWTLKISMAGCSGVPGCRVPKIAGICEISICIIEVISCLSVMMSYKITPFAAAILKDSSSIGKFSGVMTIGLSARTFNPASTDFLMYSLLMRLYAGAQRHCLVSRSASSGSNPTRCKLPLSRR